MKPTICHSPSVEMGSTVGETFRHSLYHDRNDFIQRVGPMGMAAIYFGTFSLGPQDAALSRQALFKLSFIYRHFLRPAGLAIMVQRGTAILSGAVERKSLIVLAEVLAQQIEGLTQVKDETKPVTSPRRMEQLRERVQLLFATDQTMHSSLRVEIDGAELSLHGEVATAKQGRWIEQLALAVGAEVGSNLEIVTPTHPAPATKPIDMDDESLQALVLFRLRMARETEHLPLKVKANRGVVTMQGKVRTEALRQQVENLTRSTLGLKELRSTLTIEG